MPITVLVFSFIASMAQVSLDELGTAPIHEDGVRSLVQTVFFFDHALGELPLDLLLAAFIAASVASRNSMNTEPQRALRRSRQLAYLTALLVLVIAGGSFTTVGWSDSLYSFLQEMTRRDLSPAWGSHWHYHLLSRLALGAWAVSLVAFLSPQKSVQARLTQRERFILWLFCAATVLSLPDWNFLLNGRYLGHQARELATHAITTVPLALFVAFKAIGATLEAKPNQARCRAAWPYLLIVLVIGIYLISGTFIFGGLDEKQTTHVTPLLFGHVLEHALGYAVTASAAGYLSIRWSMK